MLVFLSWSGDQSKLVAEALENWLRQVVQAVDPWISTDISKGLRWGPEIADRLEKSKVGIICLARENLESRWILYEAGALSKTKDAYVCTLLLGLRPTDIEQPLAQFQHTTTDKEDMRQLVHTVNAAVLKCGEKALSDPILDDVFNTYWPRLEQVFTQALAMKHQQAKQERSEREILQEILELLRNQERRQSATDVRERVSELLRRTTPLQDLIPLQVTFGDMLAKSAAVDPDNTRRLLAALLAQTKLPQKPPAGSDKTTNEEPNTSG